MRTAIAFSAALSGRQPRAARWQRDWHQLLRQRGGAKATSRPLQPIRKDLVIRFRRQRLAREASMAAKEISVKKYVVRLSGEDANDLKRCLVADTVAASDVHEGFARLAPPPNAPLDFL